MESAATGAHQQLHLALEVAALPQSADSDKDPFAPRPRLDDILPQELGGAIYASAEQLYPSLAHRLHRLWHERGDFSKFKRSALNLDDNQTPLPEPPHFGITSPASASPSSPADAQEGQGQSQQEQRNAVAISVQDAESIKASMLQRIGNAHFATYFLHNLVALLLQYQTAQRKLQLEQQSAIAQSQVQILSGTNKQQQPQPNSITSIPEPAANTPQQHQEPYFDPKILALSEVFPDPSLPQNQHQNASHSLVDDDDDDDDEQKDDTKAQQQEQQEQQPQASTSEPSIPIDQTSFPALATTRATLTRASSILRSGASSIRRVAGSSSSTATSEQTRWAGLAALQTSSSASWKLAPAPQNVGVGSAVWWGGLSDREDGEGAGAKDAWVGYGLPEVQPRFRRNAMAYFADEDLQPPSSTPSSTTPRPAGSSSEPLVFLHRPGRRLRLTLISPEGVELNSDSTARQKSTGDDMMESDEGGGPSRSGTSAPAVENVLREAQEELLDEELWSNLLAQVQNTSAVVIRTSSALQVSGKPAQSSAAGTSAALSSATTPASTPAPQLAAEALAPVMESQSEGGTKKEKKKRRRLDAASSDTERIEVRLGGGWKLVLQMGRAEPIASASPEPTGDSAKTSPSSALPRILLAYFRLSVLRSIRLRLRARNESSTKVNNSKSASSASAASGSQTKNSDKGKSQAQLEREAAAASSKRGVGAYEVVSGSKLKQQQLQATPSSTTAAGDAGKEKEKALGVGTKKESYLDPVLGLFRYATFVADVELILDGLSRRGGDGVDDEKHSGKNERNGRRIWYRLSPLASLVDTSAWLRTFLDEGQSTSAQQASASGLAAPGTTTQHHHQQMDAVRMLSGMGTVFCDDSPLVLINFSYPARLSVQFARREMLPRWTGELSLDVFKKFLEREIGEAKAQ
ncbi:hypothetical protein CF319_g7205 [Tilletia indica]|nr:hypothetical protein CF319_g7205 [Tilletia indica]